MATSAAAAKTPVQAVPPAAAAPRKKSKLLLIGIVLAAVLGAAAAAWFFMSAQGDADEQKVSSKPSVFLPVDQFTVNLQPEDGQQYLQVAMTLKLADQGVADAIKAHMPEVRSRVLLLLSSKKPSELVTLDGKTRLIDEIAREVEAPLAPEKMAKPVKVKADADGRKPKAKAKAKSRQSAAEEAAPAARVLAVYFTHFIVQ